MFRKNLNKKKSEEEVNSIDPSTVNSYIKNLTILCEIPTRRKEKKKHQQKLSVK